MLLDHDAGDAVLSLNPVRGSTQEAAPVAHPLLGSRGARSEPLTAGPSIATSALRPRGPLLEQASALLAQLLIDRLQAR
ncbi:MAG: hypothetical protein LH480_02290 [Rubrivivax sp.]|nr:hypothetical protein [Rubrivivax sp.]